MLGAGFSQRTRGIGVRVSARHDALEKQQHVVPPPLRPAEPGQYLLRYQGCTRKCINARPKTIRARSYGSNSALRATGVKWAGRIVRSPPSSPKAKKQKEPRKSGLMARRETRFGWIALGLLAACAAGAAARSRCPQPPSQPRSELSSARRPPEAKKGGQRALAFRRHSSHRHEGQNDRAMKSYEDCRPASAPHRARPRGRRAPSAAP